MTTHVVYFEQNTRTITTKIEIIVEAQSTEYAIFEATRQLIQRTGTSGGWDLIDWSDGS